MKYIFLVFMLFLRFSGISQTIHYVKETSSGSGNGTSWANASGDLQAMINKATAGDTIWVAAGTYKPVRTAEGWSNGAPEATNNALPDGNRNNAFVMKSGVVILGGFRSNADDITDISLAQRNWATNVTILSGDIGIMGNSTDNAYHVVCAVNIINSVLDGFTITGGNANGDPVILISINGNIHRINRGGGIYTYGVTDTKFINLIVRNNDADMHGGGMVNRSNSAPVVINSVFCNNNTTSTSGGGGGIANDQSSPVFVNLTVSKNHATSSQSNQSGGIMNTNNSHATIYNSIIWGNTWGSPPNIGIGDVEFNANTFPNTLTYVNCLVGNTALGFNVPPPSYTTPGFVNPSIDNFRLLGGSVAIDIAADSILNALGITTDLDGLPRFFGSHADLGAYENQGVVITPDANGIVYVKKHVSTGDGTGQSWFNAAKELA
ncbi:MAG: hypothetical protein LBQ64_03595, partial [Bacteroidales bacterium]|nr:hypothetical protein [Bacteroidales bacterium]